MSAARILAFEEYEPVRIGDTADGITPAQLAHIEKTWTLTTGRKVTSFFDYGSGFVKPKNWIGSIGAPGVTLQVSPKGSKSLSEPQQQTLDRNVGQMLRTALSESAIALAQAETSTSGDRYEKAIEALCDIVLKARRMRVIRKYQTRVAETRACRGRISFPQQLFHELRRPGFFSSRWVELDEDCPENRFVKGVLTLYRRWTTASLRRRVEDVLVEFDGTQQSSSLLEEFRRIRFERLSLEYRKAITLAKGLLDGDVAGLLAGSSLSRSEVVFMPDLWEAFVWRVVREASMPHGWATAFKSKSRYLGVWKTGNRKGKTSFELIPDVELTKEGSQPTVIFDAKWKWLKPESSTLGISEDDAYQMVAYSRRFGCKNAVLVYPWLSGKSPLGGDTPSLSIAGPGPDMTLSVTCLPLLWEKLGSAVADFKAAVAPMVASA